VEQKMSLSSSESQNYMPQLDALRFFAVLGVMVAHLWHPNRLPWLFGDLDWAGLGVRLFFVLSGFLITGILLDCRRTAGKTGMSTMFFIRQFYARRFLRIFPIYYLVVIIALIVNLPPAREIWGWLITYTTNVYITVNNEWIGRFGHFWTLAVEEQFYLIWPWIILLIPRKRLLPVMLFFISLGPIYRLFAYKLYPFDIGAMDFKAATLTLGNLDSLTIGALLALAWRSNIPKQTLQKYMTRIVLPVGLLLYTICLVFYHYRIKPSVFFVLGDFSAALVFAWLISSAGLGFKGLAGKVLELKPLNYLGKITYGIYVYHYFPPLILAPLLSRFGYELRVPGLTNFVLSGLVTLVVASISWHWLEQPINNFKRYFQYASPSADHKPEPRQVVIKG
jgi:peptidoglycan/LPS O-acetylase OafA/YrhL